jgi:hypothetical protein
VCRPGGKIGMANWTPESFIGQIFKTLGRHIALPAGVSSPALWGTQPFIEQHFGPQARNIVVQSKAFTFRYRSPEHFIDVFRTYYGPMHKAFLALDPERQAVLTKDLLATIAGLNQATDGSMQVPSAYLEIIVTKA